MSEFDTSVPDGADADDQPSSKGGGGGRGLSPRGWLLLGAAVLGVLAGVVAVSTLVGGSMQVEANTPINEPGLVHANNSPAAASNPTDPDNVAVVHRVDRPEFSAELNWTADGGETWQHTELPLPDGVDRPFAPDVAFGPDGELYVSYVDLVGRGNTPDNLWLARSDDGGETLSDPVQVAGELAFQARLAVDDEGTVHLTWLDAEDVALLSLPERAPIVAAHSTDGGETFSEPVEISDPDRERVGAAVPAVDADGDLVVLYKDFKDNRRDFQNLEGPPWDGPEALVATRSEDGGESFEPGVEIDDNLIPTERFLVFLPNFPSLAAGPDGGLYASWSDGRHGDRDVFLARSDNGESWSDPVRVNDNPTEDGTDQYLPAVSVAPNGRVDVVFHDRRHDPDNVMTDAYLAYSHDGGETFGNARISADSFDSQIGLAVADHLEPDLGSRLAVVSWEDTALPIWTDTRLGERETDRQDIVVSRVTYPDPGVLSSHWTSVGLLVAAVGLLLAGRSSRVDTPA